MNNGTLCALHFFPLHLQIFRVNQGGTNCDAGIKKAYLF